MPKEGETTERQRRSPAEIRVLILGAARAEFARKGYAGTTYRDIATAADVAMSVLYRNFETKSELFSEAVVEPFVAGVETLLSDWIAQVGDPLPDEHLMRVFIGDMQAAMVRHQHALEQLVLGRAELTEAMAARITAVFDRLFAQTRMMAELEARRRGWFSPDDLDLPIRVLVCMLAGASAFGWFLLPAGARDQDDTTGSEPVLDTMSKLALWGLARKPPTDVPR